jgi:hypothetical protein
VSRTVDNQVKTIAITEDALLEPGDVIEVKRLRSRERARASSLGVPAERKQASAGALSSRR